MYVNLTITVRGQGGLYLWVMFSIRDMVEILKDGGTPSMGGILNLISIRELNYNFVLKNNLIFILMYNI